VGLRGSWPEGLWLGVPDKLFDPALLCPEQVESFHLVDEFRMQELSEMRAAIYARVSSEKQEKEHTIGSQLEALRNYAAQHGMNIVEEFTDEGYSGARLDRPALDRMRDLAERRGFEVLLTYGTDRLARKFVLQALLLEEMERFGVKAIFLEGGAVDDPLSKLMHQITGAVAEFERAKITERNRPGRLYRARCGERESSLRLCARSAS